MNYKKWKQISDDGYSSDVVSILQFIKDEEELDAEHMKTNSILSLLNRKELINGDKLTVLGEELLKSLDLEELTPKIKKVDLFEDWWKVYPSTDNFVINGKTFAGVQSKKKDKEKCKKHFQNLINLGFLAEDIIRATNYHIESAKKISLQRSQNQITYISGSEIYLRNKVFEPFIEISKQEIKEEVFKSNII